jgi:hypothetical protein
VAPITKKKKIDTINYFPIFKFSIMLLLLYYKLGLNMHSVILVIK